MGHMVPLRVTKRCRVIHIQVTPVITDIFPTEMTQLVNFWVAVQIGIDMEILGLNKHLVGITNFRITLC